MAVTCRSLRVFEKLPAFGALRACGGSHMHCANPLNSPSDYDLSLGKIIDTLRCDYPAMCERRPDFAIYDEGIAFELGAPFDLKSVLRGKRTYRRALLTLQKVARGFLYDDSVTVTCKFYDGKSISTALKVPWTCRGFIRGSNRPMYISGISHYSIAERSQGIRVSSSGTMSLSHTIHHHTIDFVEIEPPSLRSFIPSLWLQPQLCPVLYGESTSLFSVRNVVGRSVSSIRALKEWSVKPFIWQC